MVNAIGRRCALASTLCLLAFQLQAQTLTPFQCSISNSALCEQAVAADTRLRDAVAPAADNIMSHVEFTTMQTEYNANLALHNSLVTAGQTAGLGAGYAAAAELIRRFATLEVTRSSRNPDGSLTFTGRLSVEQPANLDVCTLDALDCDELRTTNTGIRAILTALEDNVLSQAEYLRARDTLLPAAIRINQAFVDAGHSFPGPNYFGRLQEIVNEVIDPARPTEGTISVVATTALANSALEMFRNSQALARAPQYFAEGGFWAEFVEASDFGDVLSDDSDEVALATDNYRRMRLFVMMMLLLPQNEVTCTLTGGNTLLTSARLGLSNLVVGDFTTQCRLALNRMELILDGELVGQ